MTIEQVFQRIESAARRKNRVVRMSINDATALRQTILDLSALLKKEHAEREAFEAQAEGEFAAFRIQRGEFIETSRAARDAAHWYFWAVACFADCPWWRWRARRGHVADVLRTKLQLKQRINALGALADAAGRAEDPR